MNEIKECIEVEVDWFEYEEESIKKYDKVMNSDLSILRVWISILDNEKFIVKPRANNIFYCDCPLHYANDYPVCVDEKLKGFYCYSCGRGGSVVKFVAEYFRIRLVEALNILYSFVTNELIFLNEEELKILDNIVRNYNSEKADNYFNISKEKTDFLNQRIDRYIEQNGYSNDIVKKMQKRLCCTHSYIRNRYLNLK